jgi:hypothetical protein
MIEGPSHYTFGFLAVLLFIVVVTIVAAGT